jgi:AraC-like DNA-binding protein
MPLFIDLHIDPSLTPEDVKQCHVADKEIQEKYGVRYLQILLNQPQGHLFCLVEGPDKETCARVHREAHGNVACNVLEITESDFSMLLIGKQKDESDFTIHADGTVDTGVRAILTFQLLGTPENCEAAKPAMLAILHKYGGKNTESLLSPSTVIFHSCTSAVDAAVAVKKNLEAASLNIETRLGISIGMPLGKEGIFFEAARKSAGQFAFIADKNAITLNMHARSLYHGNLKIVDGEFKILNQPEEKFLAQLMDYLEKTWSSTDLNISVLADEMGMSKSQFNRKLKSITPLSPNDLIKEFRLRKSIELMYEQDLNVAEVTMAIGFSNPSYFTKCFRTRFGQSPTEYLAAKVK